jgi:Na+-driven multidrug efflux pump
MSLATKEMITPLISIIVSFSLNVLGDYILVGRLNMGLKGAAIATSLSSMVASLCALKNLCKNYGISASSFFQGVARNAGVAPLKQNSSFKQSTKQWLQSSRARLAPFGSTSFSIFMGQMASALTYSAGAHVTSYCPENMSRTIQVGAHQLCLQIWWLLSSASVPLMLVAQACLPSDIRSRDWTRCNDMSDLLTSYSAIIGAVLGISSYVWIVFAPNMVTASYEIQSVMKSVAWQIALSQFAIDMSTTMNGLLIGAGMRMEYITSCVVSTGLTWLFYAFSIHQKLGLKGTWNGLLAFSSLRFLFNGLYYRKFKRTISGGD